MQVLIVALFVIGIALGPLFEKIFLRPKKSIKKRELKLVYYSEADTMLKANEGWRLAPEEDSNNLPGAVYLERYV